jgi:hypothetical protein
MWSVTDHQHMSSVVVLVVPPYAPTTDAIWPAIRNIIVPAGGLTDGIGGLDTAAHRMCIFAADDFGDLTERELQEPNTEGRKLVSALRHARYAQSSLQLFYGTLVVLRDPPNNEKFTTAGMSLTPRELSIVARHLSFDSRH